jgi:3-isopropylmalate dehydrogenase
MGTLVIMAGEGVGPEVVREARRVVEWFATEGGVDIDIREELYGTEAYERHGTSSARPAGLRSSASRSSCAAVSVYCAFAASSASTRI